MKIFKISLVALFAFALIGCSQLMNLVQPKSPTQAMKNFVEASQKRDVEAIKKSLSAGTLKMMEGIAKMQGKTLDETIKEGDTGGNDFKQMPEMRNEKIEGDTGTLEIKNEKTGEWETLYFVKENEDWKIALDKSLEEMFKKTFSDWKMPNFDDLNKNTDSEKPSTEKKP